MKNFILDHKLKNDCFIIGKLEFCFVLLMNNAQVPWFILVPQTEIIEIFDLSPRDQNLLQAEISFIAKFLKNTFPDVTKLNVASIGNIVSQLHVHVVGRNVKDYYWPNVVWGAKGAIPYQEDKVLAIKKQLSQMIAFRKT